MMYEYQALSVCFILFVYSCVLTCVYDMQQYMAEKVPKERACRIACTLL